MGPTDTPIPDVHPLALLLPWYVNGTLSKAERLQLDEHLANCAACRAELAELQLIALRVRTASEEAPAADRFPAIRSQLQARQRGQSDTKSMDLVLALRRLFAPAWMPTAAVALLLVQSVGLILAFQRTAGDQTVTTRALVAPVTRLRVSFQPTASEQDMRQLLLAVHGRLVAGPSPNGEYTIEVPSRDPDRVAQMLGQLRHRTDLVRAADRVP